MTEQMSNSDTDNDDDDNAAENLPRPPQRDIMYNGEGVSNSMGDMEVDQEFRSGSKRPGRSKTGMSNQNANRQRRHAPGSPCRSWIAKVIEQAEKSATIGHLADTEVNDTIYHEAGDKATAAIGHRAGVITSELRDTSTTTAAISLEAETLATAPIGPVTATKATAVMGHTAGDTIGQSVAE